VNKIKEIKYISTFSGIGGFEQGLKQAGGFKRMWSNDINKVANRIYTRHFGKENHYSGDICGVDPKDIPKHDLICGGFPCQSFSYSGKRKGFEDTRGTLFFEICRITEHHRPTMLFLENVDGLLTHDEGKTFGTILSTLNDMGYNVEWQVFNSKNYGRPQNRPRVFIVGHLRTGCTRPILPIFGHTRGTIKVTHKITGKTPSGLSRMNDRMYSIEGISPCLTGSFTSFPVKMTELKRGITPTEAERLQGFPDGWTKGESDNNRFQRIGNAVTVDVIEIIGKKIYKTLSLDETKKRIK